jgi:hypothetical protein
LLATAARIRDANISVGYGDRLKPGASNGA